MLDLRLKELKWEKHFNTCSKIYTTVIIFTLHDYVSEFSTFISDKLLCLHVCVYASVHKELAQKPFD